MCEVVEVGVKDEEYCFIMQVIKGLICILRFFDQLLFIENVEESFYDVVNEDGDFLFEFKLEVNFDFQVCV